VDLVTHSAHAGPDRITEPGRRVARSAVTDADLDVGEHAALVGDSAAGAVATFAGVVRDHDHGRRVERLRYVAHPSAASVLDEIAAEVSRRFPVDAVAVSHRIGDLPIGGVALAAAVSSAHRREAFEAVSELVELIKHRLPVWKHQFLADGTDEWVSCP
jgi:molybdopterin synthase catalytic subunit